MVYTGRRRSIRVGLEALANELSGGRERPGLVVDVSPNGLRLERPFTGGPRFSEVQLELELPEVDEVLWARGEVRFDQVRRGAPGGLIRSTGIRIAAAARRDLRLLQEFWAAHRRDHDDLESVSWSLGDASCYRA